MGWSCGIDWVGCTKDLGDSGGWDCRDSWTGVKLIGALCAGSWLTGLLGLGDRWPEYTGYGHHVDEL